MAKSFNVAVVGATGAVGVEMLKTLEKRNFPVKNLKLLASERSVGKTLKFKGEVRKKFLALFTADKTLLDTSFMEIDKLYGSIDNFYKEICSLDDNKITTLKEKYGSH